MTELRTVDGGGRIRLFCALRLSDDTLDRIVWWQREHLDGRVVGRSQLHITHALLRSRPPHEVPAIVSALEQSVAERPLLRATRYRETRSVGMIVLDDVDGRATHAAERLHRALTELGVDTPERRPWLPHVTVLRFREPRGLRPPLPDLGDDCPSEVAVYSSVLRPTGAQYEVLQSVAWKEQ